MTHRHDEPASPWASNRSLATSLPEPSSNLLCTRYAMHDIKSERKLGGHDGSSELTLTLPGILVDPPACSVRPNMPEERIQPGQQGELSS